MTTETASPQGDNAAAGAASQSPADAANHDQQNENAEHAQEGGAGEGEEGSGQQKKPEKTADQREIDRLRRRVDNLTRQKHELRGAAAAQQQQHHQQQNDEGDDEPVSMTRAELKQHIAEQAKQLAPAIKQQQAVADHRAGVITSLTKEWGPEKFDAMASDLDDVFGGLTDRSGAPKPATDAIFESDNPKGLIEYLTDPDNAEEAERIATMSPIQAGRAIARIEDKLTAAGKVAKPKPSNAAAPLETPRNGGGTSSSMPDPSNTKAYIAWANAQEKGAR